MNSASTCGERNAFIPVPDVWRNSVLAGSGEQIAASGVSCG